MSSAANTMPGRTDEALLDVRNLLVNIQVRWEKFSEDQTLS